MLSIYEYQQLERLIGLDILYEEAIEVQNVHERAFRKVYQLNLQFFGITKNINKGKINEPDYHFLVQLFPIIAS